jgi:hypothetical protein
MARVHVWHEGPFVGAVHVMMRSPISGVARDLYRRGQNVRTRAVQNAGSDSGRLRTSIHVEQVIRGDTLVTRVGSNVEHAAVHHTGHGPIVPRQPGGVLVFPVRGRWVFTKHVRAVEGTEFLRKALPAARG